MAEIITREIPGKREPSELRILGDSLKNFNQLVIGDKIEGNFSGVIKTLSEPESGEKGNPKQSVEIALETIYIDRKNASSESKNKSMDNSWDKARRMVKRLSKTLSV